MGYLGRRVRGLDQPTSFVFPSASLEPTAEVTLLCDGMRDILPRSFLFSEAGVGEVQVRNQFEGFSLLCSVFVAV